MKEEMISARIMAYCIYRSIDSVAHGRISLKIAEFKFEKKKKSNPDSGLRYVILIKNDVMFSGLTTPPLVYTADFDSSLFASKCQQKKSFANHVPFPENVRRFP